MHTSPFLRNLFFFNEYVHKKTTYLVELTRKYLDATFSLETVPRIDQSND